MRKRVVIHVDLDEDEVSYETLKKDLERGDVFDRCYDIARMGTVRVVLVTDRVPEVSETDRCA